MENNDVDTWAREAHTIKSGARDLGGLKLAQKSEELETKGKEGSTEGIQELLAEIEREFQTFSTTLADYLQSDS